MTKKQYAELMAAYIAALPSLKKSEKTVASYQTALYRFCDFLDGTGTRDITPKTVSEYRTHLYGEGLNTNSIRYYIIVLGTFFDWAIRTEQTDKNPVQPSEIPEETFGEYNLLTHEQIETLIERKSAPKGMDSNKQKRNRAIMLLLLQSGLRNSELRHLSVSDLDFDDGKITVRHGKGDKKRVAPFPAQAREAVKEYLSSGLRPKRLKPSDLLFGTDADESGHSTGGKSWREMAAVSLNSLVKRYVKAAVGIDVHCHTLRHCAASMWDDLGVPMRDVQKALGHSSVRTTERTYVHILNKEKAALSINQAFGG